jgi:hypothetical protein
MAGTIPPPGVNGEKYITLSNGEVIDTEEIGTDYIVGAAKEDTIPELVDPHKISKDVLEREEFVSRQELTVKTSGGYDAKDLITTVVKEIAEELSNLKYERKRAAREGKNTANYTISRVTALRQLADLLLKRLENARAEELDLKSPRFREVLKLWMEFVYESMVKVQVSDQVIDLVFRQIEADMKDWEQRVVNLG